MGGLGSIVFLTLTNLLPHSHRISFQATPLLPQGQYFNAEIHRSIGNK